MSAKDWFDDYSALQVTWVTMPNWKWLSLAFVFLLFPMLLKLGRQLLSKLQAASRNRWLSNEFINIFLQLDIHYPLTGILIGYLYRTATLAIDISGWVAQVSNTLVTLYLGYHFIVLVYFAAHAGGLLLERWARKTSNTLDDQLAPFAGKVLKVSSVIVGILLVVQNLGFNVMSLLAGLGLGGLALALAAQDTAANLFGSITVILDRPFQMGDLVRIGDTLGTVEDVGFRSTSLRTLNKSIVSIPNAMVAKEKIENLGARTSRRFRHTLGLTYQSSSVKINQVIDSIRYTLATHPKILKEDLQVNLISLGAYSIDILVSAYMDTNDILEEFQIQQELLFEIIKIVESTGCDFAYPTQTLFTQAQKLGTGLGQSGVVS